MRTKSPSKSQHGRRPPDSNYSLRQMLAEKSFLVHTLSIYSSLLYLSRLFINPFPSPSSETLEFFASFVTGNKLCYNRAIQVQRLFIYSAVVRTVTVFLPDPYLLWKPLTLCRHTHTLTLTHLSMKCFSLSLFIFSLFNIFPKA